MKLGTKSALRAGLVTAFAAALIASGTTAASAKPGLPYVQYGDSGESVKCVQKLFNAWAQATGGFGNPIHLDVDGVFGGDTLTAIKYYQNKVASTPDGIVGPDTGSSLYQWNDGYTAYCWNYLPTYI